MMLKQKPQGMSAAVTRKQRKWHVFPAVAAESETTRKTRRALRARGELRSSDVAVPQSFLTPQSKIKTL